MDSRETRTYLTATVLVIGSLFVCGTAFDSVFLRHRSGLLALSNLIAGLALVGLVASVVAGKLRCTAGSMCACLIAGAAWIPCWPLSWQHHLGFGIAVLSLYALGIPALSDWLDKRAAVHPPAPAIPPQMQAPPPKALGGAPAAAQQHDSRQGGDPLSDDVYPEPKAAAVRVVAPVLVANRVLDRMAAVSVLPRRPQTVVDDGIAHVAAQTLLQEMEAWRVNCGGQMFVAAITPLAVRFRYQFGLGAEGRLPDGPAVAERQAAITSCADELAGALGFNPGALTVERPPAERRYVDLVVSTGQQSLHFRESVTLREYSEAKRNGVFVAMVGQCVSTGKLITADLGGDGKPPNVLIAGETRVGKGCGTNSFLLSLLMSYSDTEVTIIDPKGGSDFGIYADIPGVKEVVGDADIDRASVALAKVVTEMRRREDLAPTGVKNINMFNKRADLVARHGRMGRYVVVVDEVAELAPLAAAQPKRKASAISGDEPPPVPRFNDSLATLTQRGAAFGIHVVLVTQHPNADIISGMIKGNLGIRIAFKCADRISSGVVFGNDSSAPDASRIDEKGRAWVRLGGVYQLVQFPFLSDDDSVAVVRELARMSRQDIAGGTVAA